MEIDLPKEKHSTVMTSSTVNPTSANSYEAPQLSLQADFPELLQVYYNRLFPYKKYYRWLSYGNVNKHYFHNREFSFTLKGDIYIRFKSFTDIAEFQKELQQICPYKIDIGAVYNAKPKEHRAVKASEFRAIERELVFDIDMTDYDEIRTCCSGAAICVKCWPFMTIAMKIIDAALKDDFGFQHRLWVYSGRRGIHCWVCDESVRKYDQNSRTAIADYLTTVKGSDQQAKKVSFAHLHPSIARAKDIIEEHFQQLVLLDQDLLRSQKHIDMILSMIPDEQVRTALKESWDYNPSHTSIERWDELVEVVGMTVKRNPKLKYFIEELMFQLSYPRLDVNVSKGVNHLLKSPFCVHPSTGRVCIPIDIDQVDHFDPFSVPTLSDLCNQINEFDAQHPEAKAASGKKLQDYKKTSMKNHLEVFKKFLLPLEGEIRELRKSIQMEDEQW